MNAPFVVVEGVEGAGKSTLIAALADRLRRAGRDPVVTFEPGDTALGAELRRLLLHGDHPDPWAELMLYLADRAEHLAKVVEPALAAGRPVLCDRFTDSTIAYQGHGRQLDLAAVTAACELAERRRPDRVVVLDLDPVEGLARAKGRGQGADRMEAEALDFHRRVRAGFLARAEADPGRYLVVDAARGAEAVAAAAVAGLEGLLP